MSYGNIWQFRTYPVPDATVVTDQDVRLTGTLSRNWDKSWLIVADDVATTHFTSYRVMSIRGGLGSENPSSTWRGLLPMLMVNVALFAALFALWKQEDRASQRRRN